MHITFASEKYPHLSEQYKKDQIRLSPETCAVFDHSKNEGRLEVELWQVDET